MAIFCGDRIDADNAPKKSGILKMMQLYQQRHGLTANSPAPAPLKEADSPQMQSQASSKDPPDHSEHSKDINPLRHLKNALMRQAGTSFQSARMTPSSQNHVMAFVVMSSQRSGSNLLLELLESRPDIVCHNEIFHPT